MPKRFTATDIWSEDWFLVMPSQYKLFWYYMLSKCDHAGFFKVNVRNFCALNEVNLTPKEVLEYFNSGKHRIREVSPSVWLIEDFFGFQYGPKFNPNNRVHLSVLDTCIQHGVNLGSIRGIKEVEDRVKDKDKEQDKDSKKPYKKLELNEKQKNELQRAKSDRRA